ncbi:MAG: hypothetical protein AAB580_04460 [Patescibacteria group bacterium]
MLITRPNHDVTTNYLYFWSQELINQAKKNNLKVVDLAKKRANAKEFNSVIKKIKPSLIVINGHGNGSSVAGYDDEPLVIAGQNEIILNKAIVYARSCKSAETLGPKSIKSGCKTYIGYDDDFVFVTEDNKLTKPLEDKTSEMFMEPSNYIVISLLKGHTTDDANQRSKKLFKHNIQKLTTSIATKEDNELIPYLVWDYSHQVCLGDPNAAI